MNMFQIFCSMWRVELDSNAYATGMDSILFETYPITWVWFNDLKTSAISILKFLNTTINL